MTKIISLSLQHDNTFTQATSPVPLLCKEGRGEVEDMNIEKGQSLPRVYNKTMATETVTLEGHIIDSLILAKVLDTILQRSGTFTIKEMHVGATREDASSATIAVHADSPPRLAAILHAIQPHGAEVEHAVDCIVEPAPKDGVLPDSFYATSHLRTQIRLNHRWLDVEAIEMDLAIRVTLEPPTACTVPMADVKAGDLIVTGRTGVRVFPLERPQERDAFAFMAADVSSERPHHPMIADVAKRMRMIRDNRQKAGTDGESAWDPDLGTKVLFVGGPAIIHAGGREALSWLIESGFIHVLFCGNALAAHDMEASLFGTSLGYGLRAGCAVPHGHEHHLRTINRVRNAGSLTARGGIRADPRRGHRLLCPQKRQHGVGGKHSRRRTATRRHHGHERRPNGHARRAPGRRARVAGGDDAARHRHRELFAREGSHRVRGHQPGRSHQTQRPRQLPIHRPGDGRGVLPSTIGASTRLAWVERWHASWFAHRIISGFSTKSTRGCGSPTKSTKTRAKPNGGPSPACWKMTRAPNSNG